ncbi:MAG: DUF4013 domain-containing protein [Methanoregula sp.]|nr:DUF4013 domain-containing protein [Methanoregula sp.]
MDYVNLLDDALTYTKEGIFGKADRWTKLIVAIICLGIPMNGYVMRIYRGATPAPEVDRWETLFVDGLKLMIVGFIYAIPIFIVWILAYGSMLMGVISGSMTTSAIDGWTPNLGLMLLMYVVEIIVGIILPVASIRFARTNSFPEAFNFSAIVDTIKQIGWINYIIAIVLIAVVIGIPICILIFGFILVGGIIAFALGFGNMVILAIIAVAVLILLVILPLIGVFQARYMTRVYDSAAIEV